MKFAFGLVLISSLLSNFAHADLCLSYHLNTEVDDINYAAQKISNSCYGTEFQEVEEQLKNKLRIANSRLETKKLQLRETAELLEKAKTTSLKRIAAASGIVATVTLASGGMTLPLTVGKGAAWLGLTASFANLVNMMGSYTSERMASKAYADMEMEYNFKTQNLISQIDKESKKFESANDEIMNLRDGYQKELKEGGGLSVDDVTYLSIQLEAEKAQIKIYHNEIVYYKTIGAELVKSCTSL